MKLAEKYQEQGRTLQDEIDDGRNKIFTSVSGRKNRGNLLKETTKTREKRDQLRERLNAQKVSSAEARPLGVFLETVSWQHKGSLTGVAKENVLP